MSGPTPARSAAPSLSLLVVVAVVVVAALGALVGLELAGKDTTPVTTFVAPITAALLVAIGVGGYVGVRLDRQDTQLTTIHTNTNGTLDARIAAAVKLALDSRGVGVLPAASPDIQGGRSDLGGTLTSAEGGA